MLEDSSKLPEIIVSLKQNGGATGMVHQDLARWDADMVNQNFLIIKLGNYHLLWRLNYVIIDLLLN